MTPSCVPPERPRRAASDVVVTAVVAIVLAALLLLVVAKIVWFPPFWGPEVFLAVALALCLGISTLALWRRAGRR